MKGILTLLTLILFAGCSAPESEKEIFYLGTFSDDGLFVLEFDRESRSFSEVERQSDPPSQGFQAIHPDGDVLYSIAREGLSEADEQGSVIAYQIDPETGALSQLNRQSSMGAGPAHVSVDPHGRFLYVSNYSAGNLASYPLSKDGRIGEAADVVHHEGSSINERRQQAPYVHAANPSADGRFLYVSDLGTDKIMIYAVDEETGELSPAETPWAEVNPGSGPRHFTFHPSQAYAYSVDELSSTVTAFRVDSETGVLDNIQRIGMLPESFEEDSWAADIHISPNGRFLYATNRGHDSLAIYSVDPDTGLLELIGHEPTRGGHPRNFAIDQYGEFLFMTNRDDNNLVLFEMDQETGLLNYTGVEVEIPLAVCVTQHILR